MVALKEVTSREGTVPPRRARRVAQRDPPSGNAGPSCASRFPTSTTLSPDFQFHPGGGELSESTTPSSPTTGVGSMSLPPLSL